MGGENYQKFQKLALLKRKVNWSDQFVAAVQRNSPITTFFYTSGNSAEVYFPKNILQCTKLFAHEAITENVVTPHGETGVTACIN
jgi:hypothetical protein